MSTAPTVLKKLNAMPDAAAHLIIPQWEYRWAIGWWLPPMELNPIITCEGRKKQIEIKLKCLPILLDFRLQIQETCLSEATISSMFIITQDWKCNNPSAVFRVNKTKSMVANLHLICRNCPNTTVQGYLPNSKWFKIKCHAQIFELCIQIRGNSNPNQKHSSHNMQSQGTTCFSCIPQTSSDNLQEPCIAEENSKRRSLGPVYDQNPKLSNPIHYFNTCIEQCFSPHFPYRWCYINVFIYLILYKYRNYK